MMTVRSMSLRPVRGSTSCGQLLQHAGHLVAALAAAEVDDHVGGAALRERLQQHGLAGAEAAGDGRLAAQGHGEERVEDALPGDERLASWEGAAPRAGARARARRATSRLPPRGRRPCARSRRASRRRTRRPRGSRRARLRCPAARGRRGCGRWRGGLRPGFRRRGSRRPTLRTGRNASRAGGAGRAPGFTRASIPVSGRSRPSKMLPSSAGPTRTASGLPSPSMSVPGRRPVVSSYTCTVISSSSMRTTSPSSACGPTRTHSRRKNEPLRAWRAAPGRRSSGWRPCSCARPRLVGGEVRRRSASRPRPRPGTRAGARPPRPRPP